MKRDPVAILGLLKRRPRCGGGDAKKRPPGGPDAAGAKRSEEASGGEAPPSKRLERSRAATPLEAFLDLHAARGRRSPRAAGTARAGRLRRRRGRPRPEGRRAAER